MSVALCSSGLPHDPSSLVRSIFPRLRTGTARLVLARLFCGVRITTSVTIQGMLSVHAAHAVFTALTGVEGISTADVKVGRATIEHDGRATHEQIIGAIETAGYVVTEIRDERRLPLLGR